MENQNENIVVQDIETIISEVKKVQDKLDLLRKDGATKAKLLEDKIATIKRDKVLSKTDKKEKISALVEELKTAKTVQKESKEDELKLIKEGKEYIKTHFTPYYASVKKEAALKKQEEKSNYAEIVKNEKAEFAKRLEVFKSENNPSETDYKSKLLGLKRGYNSKLYELKLAHNKKLADIKNEVHDIYLDKVKMWNNLNNDKLTVLETIESKWEKYVFRFNIKDFLLSNGLYIVMILVFLACGILAPVMNKGQLLTSGNIFEILNQASPRIFLALGVAGLILLAGTDLSIGRLVGMGTCLTCMFLYPSVNNMPLFGTNYDFTGLPDASRILLALIVVIICTTFFSAFSGFFSAKFKMHPFISTMSTQLIVFGLTAVATNAMNTGVIDIDIRNQVAGEIGNVFPILLLYAIICVAIVSFIWNRTKFGKNMYAVGGNAEAASVSGISVFWVTMGVFIMAGILYGFGAFFEGVRIGTGKFDTGTGYETDAIAACVVGGISFSGGIGKIRGAVIGAIIFTALTYALTFLNISPYYQYIIKGIIILVAVTLDCLKYIKKK